MQNILVIYHGGCDDGFGSAWLARKKFLGAGWPEANLEFVGATHQRPPPDCTDKIVAMLDFSYKRPDMLKLVEQSFSFTWLDHHKSAIEDMKDFVWRPQDKVVLDEKRSGIGITADYFGVPRTKFIDAIEDMDLWNLKLENTKEIAMARRSYPQDFETWDKISRPEKHHDLIAEGKHIQRYYDQRVAEFVANAYETIFDGWTVPVTNCPYAFISDVVNILAKGKPFAMGYYINGKELVTSFRSDENGMDVSEIAVLHGGGGHKHAAQFKRPLKNDSDIHPPL